MSPLPSMIPANPQRRHIMPFVTAGDPDLKFTQQLLLTLDALKPGLFEIGFPYSDPIADGPVIQASYTRALGHHLKVDQIFSALAEIKDQLTQPRVGMVSYAIILRYGVQRFLEQATAAGFSGLIVPDFLWNRSNLAFRDECRENGLHLIPLITPTTTPDRAKWLAQEATGFIYYVSVAGVTGERSELPSNLVEQLTELKKSTDVPVCVGFGVSGPAQVQQLKDHCDGLIVGSAIMKRIARASEGISQEEVVTDVRDFVAELIENA